MLGHLPRTESNRIYNTYRRVNLKQPHCSIAKRLRGLTRGRVWWPFWESNPAYTGYEPGTFTRQYKGPFYFENSLDALEAVRYILASNTLSRINRNPAQGNHRNRLESSLNRT